MKIETKLCTVERIRTEVLRMSQPERIMILRETLSLLCQKYLLERMNGRMMTKGKIE